MLGTVAWSKIFWQFDVHENVGFLFIRRSLKKVSFFMLVSSRYYLPVHYIYIQLTNGARCFLKRYAKYQYICCNRFQ